MKTSKTRKIFYAITIVGLSVGVILHYFVINKTETLSEKEYRIQSIMQTEEFKQRAREEAERIYYQELIEQAEEALKALEESGFQPDAVKTTALVEYLSARGAVALVPYASQIAELPRWAEVVAIASKETSLCAYGVGKSKNNCGAIKNGSGEFKTYASKMDSIRDIASLLQTPRYKDKTLAQMNGVYCVDETESDRKCRGWDDHIESEVSAIYTMHLAVRNISKK